MFPPGLSMLWESTEPRSALKKRFDLDSFDEAVSWLTKVLAEAWAIDVQACDRIIISGHNAIAWVRTNRGALVAKWSRDQERFGKFEAIADLIQALHKQGVPVAAPLASVDGQRRVIIGSFSITVQPHIDGEFLDTTADTAVRRAGACLARLHAALATQRDSRLNGFGRHTGTSLDLRRRIETWLQHEDTGMAPAASARLRTHLASLPRIDSQPQLIHNDYRAANVLTSGSEIIAVLDFDEVALDYCVSDLANAFVLLGTRFTNWQPTPARARDALLDGYESVRPLTVLEHQWLHALVLLRGIQAIPPGDDPAGWAAAL
ncbi:homoserine kinase type II [Arthrobacter pascens]|uniref:phosphotransferase enzyme family protein n=1 Tax=Arthrobacter pascens TaxID=1677 RepID=UPI002793C5BB|nr:phosphotransferase [Arthrobacter pascens]MDQ0680701.1 homoserine kinase type II [Arthrobacter pascens]